MFCSRCGKQITTQSNFCPVCGNCLNASRPYEVDAPNAGFTVLGVFVPVAGLILWAINKDTKPLMAKSAGTGAIIGACLSAFSIIIYMIIYAIFMSSIFWYM